MNSSKPGYGGRFSVELGDGSEAVYYDPTEAVEEHAASRFPQMSLGGLSVDRGVALSSEAMGSAEQQRPGTTVAIGKLGEEEIFGYLNLPSVLPLSASSSDEATAQARRYLEDQGLDPEEFVSLVLTTHYYVAPLGRRECGWSIVFES